jgi:hypothetical protein
MRARVRGRAPLASPEPRQPLQHGADLHLYGIVQVPRQAVHAPGVGDPPRPVRVVPFGKIAALVSTVDADQLAAQHLRGIRRDMKAHAAVLNGLAATMTVLPVRFGVVVPDERTLLEHLLSPRYDQFASYLAQLEGMVEVTLRATSTEEEALRAVIAERRDLAAGSRRGAVTYESRIERGRQIASAIQDLQDRDARWIVDVLAPAARDVRIGKPLRELMALNASFLVDRDKLKTFDRRLERLHAEVGHRIRFDCVGPLAPFSFVDLRL